METVRKMLVSSVKAMHGKAAAGISRWDLDADIRDRLLAMFGHPNLAPNALASSMSTRLAAGESLIRELVQMQAEHPNRSFYHITFINDHVRTRDLDTVVDLDRLGKQVRRLLADHGIKDYVGIHEFQPYVNWKRGEGRDLAPHTHVITWSEGPLDIDALEASMGASKRLLSITGAPTVRISYRISEPAEIAHMAAYLFKAPERGANLFASRRRPGFYMQRDAAIRMDQAVRIMEVMSQFNLANLIISGGDGKAIKTPMLRVIKDRIASRRWPTQPIVRDDSARTWRKARQQARKEQYGPVVVIRGGKRR